MLLLFYFCFIIILLNHRPKYGRWLLGFFDSRLNAPILKGHHTYDDNCEITLQNLWDNFDHYYAVHLGDWFLASFVIRDPVLLHMWSLMDEVIELSWQHILPHFRECWWDHIFHDILLSNTPAIFFGLWVQSKLGMNKFDFFFKYDSKGKLLPFAQWGVWHCHRKFGIFCHIQGFLTLHFLMGFFINNNLLIPPVHPFPVIRLLLWFALGAVSFAEAHEDASTWNTVKRYYKPVSGRYRWLGIALMTSEFFMCYKYRADTGHINHDAVTPFYIWGPWTFVTLWMLWTWLYLRFKKGHTTKYPIDEVRKLKRN